MDTCGLGTAGLLSALQMGQTPADRCVFGLVNSRGAFTRPAYNSSGSESYFSSLLTCNDIFFLKPVHLLAHPCGTPPIYLSFTLAPCPVISDCGSV